MTDRPISCTVETVRAIRACRQTQIRRPAPGMLSRSVAGDRLWVREPIHLPREFEGHSPCQALELGARPFFAADGRPSPDFGRRRFAREMPRAWHRMHLRLIAVRTEPLHAIDDAGAHAEGARDLADFIARWDAANAPSTAISGGRLRWADNPRVVVLTFDWVDLPVSPRAANAAPAQSAPQPSFVPERAPDRTPCPSCGVRGDIGCEHSGARQ